MPSLLWAEMVMCRVVPKSKKRVYLSKKINKYKKKNYQTYRPMKNVPCFRKQDIYLFIFIFIFFFFFFFFFVVVASLIVFISSS